MGDSLRARRQRLLAASGNGLHLMGHVRSRSSPVSRCRQIYCTDSCTQLFPCRLFSRHRERLNFVWSSPPNLNRVRFRGRFGGQVLRLFLGNAVPNIAVSIVSWSRALNFLVGIFFVVCSYPRVSVSRCWRAQLFFCASVIAPHGSERV